MDAEFQRVLLRVAAIGGAIMLIGGGALLIAFRAFGPGAGRSRDFRAVILMIAAIAFVMVACAVLFVFSFARR